MYGAWCYEDLHVPFITRARRFITRCSARCARTPQEPADLRLIIGPRFGPVQFYEGDRRQLLMPK